MNIYSETLTYEDVQDALTAEKKAGRIAADVFFEILRPLRSSFTRYGYQIKLAAHTRGDSGRRWGNSGGYGSTSYTTGDYAATHDEWGWFLQKLYESDEYMIVGWGKKNPVYSDRWNFEFLTGETYTREALLWKLDSAEELEEIRRDLLADGHISGIGDPFPYQFGRGGKGRMGYGRDEGERRGTLASLNAAVEKWGAKGRTGNDYVRFDPRSKEAYAEFAHLQLEDALAV